MEAFLKRLYCTKYIVYFVFAILVVCTLIPINSVEAVNNNIVFGKIFQFEGISSNKINCILQDRNGYMWFGTDSGLNRYDGIVFKIFKRESGQQDSISYNWVNSIYEDHEGILWIGTIGGGLNRFDPATEAFTHFKHDPNNPNSISGDTAIAIYEDHEGILWIGTRGDGLNRFDTATETFDLPPKNWSSPNVRLGPKERGINGQEGLHSGADNQ
jgi:ligand-binding sensor domain-containing protein